MEERLGLDPERLLRSENAREELPARLDGPLRPAVLLGLEGVHLDRQFGRNDDVRQEVELPPAELGAVAEIEILGQRVVLPAAAVLNRRPPPDARGAIEVEEVAGPIPSAVLEHEVRVEQDRLNLREQRVVGVDMAPARLHHGHLRIDEVMDGLVQELARRNEVRVEDGDELALRELHPGFERARLVAGPILAV